MSPTLSLQKTLFVLLIDDSLAELVLLRCLLAELKADIQLLWRPSAAEAVAAGIPFDAVLLDLSTGKWPNSLERVRQALPDVPVIIYTGTDGQKYRNEAEALGAKAYFLKGHDPVAGLPSLLRWAVADAKKSEHEARRR